MKTRIEHWATEAVFNALVGAMVVLTVATPIVRLVALGL